MAPKPIPEALIKRTAELYQALKGDRVALAAKLKVSESTAGRYILMADQAGFLERKRGSDEFQVPDLPDEVADTGDIIERRKREYQRVAAAREARRLITIKVKIDGPFGVAHFGDPHVDDPGTDIAGLERDLRCVRDTEGLFGANLGDNHNNWTGRLARLYAHQSTSAKEAWRLVEWLLGACNWIYLVAGNHDIWSGDGDPAQWMAARNGTIYEPWGARVNLLTPSGRSFRINARHDFSGHSMWNPNHGPGKAIQAGWRDHLATCGHKHVSFISGPFVDPATLLRSWAVRCAGYKVIDKYASGDLGLPEQNAFPAAVSIFDPRYADDDVRAVHVVPTVEEGAEYLKFRRRKK